jgi:hypothetical protein
LIQFAGAERATRFSLVESGAHVAAGPSTNRLSSNVVRVTSQPQVDLTVDPETTNIKFGGSLG